MEKATICLYIILIYFIWGLIKGFREGFPENKKIILKLILINQQKHFPKYLLMSTLITGTKNGNQKYDKTDKGIKKGFREGIFRK
jgi:hypothetical protein